MSKMKHNRIIWLAKILKRGLGHAQYRPCLYSRFLYLNFFCKRVKTDLQNEGVIYLTPYSIVELRKGSLLELHGPFTLGVKTIRKSRLETRLFLDYNAKMTVNEDSSIGYGSDIEVLEDAHLIIGHCYSNFNCTIICGKKIEMQGHTAIGRDVSIRDTNAHQIEIEGYKVLRPVKIEDHVWLCSGATICPGVKIKEGAVVGANSFVIQNVPAHALVTGNPAKVALSDIEWHI